MTDIFTPAEVFAPGEYLRDELAERGWTEKEFAEIIGRPAQVVSEILNARKQIVPETALAFADALDTSPELWLNLQTAYNLCEAKSSRPSVSDVSRRSRLRAVVPVAELRRRGWLPNTNDLDILEDAIEDLMSNLKLNGGVSFGAAARRSNPDAIFTPQQTAWLARIRQLASRREVNTYDSSLLSEIASTLVHRIHDPTDLGLIEGWLAECGVALVTLLPLRSSQLDGAVMMLDNGNPVIGLTNRGDRMDSYVFTLLHELAHLSLDHLASTAVLIDSDLPSATNLDAIETAANNQAAVWILPQGIEIPPGRPSMITIMQIAHKYELHASFVIGRIQRDRKDWGLLRSSIPRVRPFLRVES